MTELETGANTNHGVAGTNPTACKVFHLIVISFLIMDNSKLIAIQPFSVIFFD